MRLRLKLRQDINEYFVGLRPHTTLFVREYSLSDGKLESILSDKRPWGLGPGTGPKKNDLVVGGLCAHYYDNYYDYYEYYYE